MVLPTPAAVADAAADRVVTAARNAIRRRGRFSIALSGGSTPQAAYALLAEQPRVGRVDWSRVEFFWGDERAEPPDHRDSNFGLAWRLLLSHLPGLRRSALHRMPADEADIDLAALAYERRLARVLGGTHRAGRPPVIDLVWLGIGRDGHTASLFPGSSALGERRRWVLPTTGPPPHLVRMTLTLPVINAARSVMLVATGADKAPVLRDVAAGRRDLPVSRVRSAGTLWLLDAAAAGGGSQ
ncbi:MAG: 6-phosphogluconolactonase [Chloroflexota bacterium]